jgi:hypothetical protein
MRKITDAINIVWSFANAILFIVMFVTTIVCIAKVEYIENKAIELGHAQFNPQTGIWEWIE